MINPNNCIQGAMYLYSLRKNIKRDVVDAEAFAMAQELEKDYETYKEMKTRIEKYVKDYMARSNFQMWGTPVDDKALPVAAYSK